MREINAVSLHTLNVDVHIILFYSRYVLVDAWPGCDDCVYVYTAACKHLKQLPITAVKERLYLQQLQLQYQGLRATATHALCLALVVSH